MSFILFVIRFNFEPYFKELIRTALFKLVKDQKINMLG
jgi:hypothetical protein